MPRSYSRGDRRSAADRPATAGARPGNRRRPGAGLAAEAAIKARQEESRIRSAVDDARRRFVKGEQLAAIQSLEALQPTANTLVARRSKSCGAPFVSSTRGGASRERAEKERVDRQRRITALLADAWAALKDRRLADAERALGLVREIDPTVPELSDLLERVQQAQAAARRNEELERTLGEFDQQLSQGDLARAGGLLQSAASLAPTDSRVHSARKRLEQATAARAAREAAEARQREGEQRIEAAAAHLAAGDLAGAWADLTRAAELAPQHPRAAELSDNSRRPSPGGPRPRPPNGYGVRSRN